MGTRLYVETASDADLLAVVNTVYGIAYTLDDLAAYRQHEAQRPDDNEGYAHYRITQEQWGTLDHFLVFGFGRLTSLCYGLAAQWEFEYYAGRVDDPAQVQAMLDGIDASSLPIVTAVHWS